MNIKNLILISAAAVIFFISLPSVVAGLEGNLTVQVGHLSDVNAVSYSPDGKIIVSGRDDNTVKLWEARTGKLLRTLTGHSSDVNAVSYNPDGKTIASGSGSEKRVKAVLDPELKKGEKKKTNIYGIFDELGMGGKGRAFMSSCRPEETSIESDELKHGVFTHFFLQALKEKKLRKLRDVYEYINLKVEDYTNLMHPRLSTDDEEGIIHIY